MFCPNYGGPCQEEDCRDWNRQEQKCRCAIEAERRTRMDAEYFKQSGFMEVFAESERMNTLRSQASLQALLNLPMLPPEEKEFIQKMLEAPSAEVAKELLDGLNL